MIDTNGANYADASIAKELLLIDKCLSDDLRDIERKTVPSDQGACDEDDSDSDRETRSPRSLAMMREELRQANTQMLAEVVAGHMAAAARRHAALDRVLALKRSRSLRQQSTHEDSSSRSCEEQRHLLELEKSSLSPSNTHLLSEVISRHKASAARRAAALKRVVALKSARHQLTANNGICVNDERALIDAVEDSCSNHYSNECFHMLGRQGGGGTRSKNQNQKGESTSSLAASEAAAVTRETDDPIPYSEKDENCQIDDSLKADPMVTTDANSTANVTRMRFSSQSTIKSACVQTDVEKLMVCPPSERKMYSVQMQARMKNNGDTNLQSRTAKELEVSLINCALKEPSCVNPCDVGGAGRNAVRSGRLTCCDAKHKTGAICGDTMSEEETLTQTNELAKGPTNIPAIIGSSAISAIGELSMESSDKIDSDAGQTRTSIKLSANHGVGEKLPKSPEYLKVELGNKPSAEGTSQLQRHQDVQCVTSMMSMTDLQTAAYSNLTTCPDSASTSTDITETGAIPSTELENGCSLNFDDILPAHRRIGMQPIDRAPFSGCDHNCLENTEPSGCSAKEHHKGAGTAEISTTRHRSYTASDYETAPTLICQDIAMQPSVPQDRRFVQSGPIPACQRRDIDIPRIRCPTGRVMPLQKEDTFELEIGDQIRIERRGSRKLPYALQRGDTIRWRFRLRNGPVGFGVCKRAMSNGGAVETEILATSRFDSSRSYCGEWLATEPTTIVLVFDNTFSMFRAKDIVCTIIIDRVCSKALDREAARGEINIAPADPQFEDFDEDAWETRYHREWQELHDARTQ